MPTLEEHWTIVQKNMDAIKRIVDDMESAIHGEFEDRHKWMEENPVPTFAGRKAEALRCYSCDTIITNIPYSIGGRQFCSRYCIAERGGEE